MFRLLREKTGEPGETPLEQGDHPTYGTRPELNPGHIGGRRTLSSLHRPRSLRAKAAVMSCANTPYHMITGTKQIGPYMC